MRMIIKPRINFIRKIILLNRISIDDFRYKNLMNDVKQELKKNNISYIYSPYPLTFVENSRYIHKIYENQAAMIYKVDGGR